VTLEEKNLLSFTRIMLYMLKTGFDTLFAYKY